MSKPLSLRRGLAAWLTGLGLMQGADAGMLAQREIASAPGLLDDLMYALKPASVIIGQSDARGPSREGRGESADEETFDATVAGARLCSEEVAVNFHVAPPAGVRRSEPGTSPARAAGTSIERMPLSSALTNEGWFRGPTFPDAALVVNSMTLGPQALARLIQDATQRGFVAMTVPLREGLNATVIVQSGDLPVLERFLDEHAQEGVALHASMTARHFNSAAWVAVAAATALCVGVAFCARDDRHPDLATLI